MEQTAPARNPLLPTDEAVAEYKEWVRRRKVESYDLFPPDAKAKLEPAIQELISLGIQNADITGSFARGDYCMNRNDVATKMKGNLNAKMSDIDFLVYDQEFQQPALSDVFDTERFKCLFDSHVIPIIRDGKIVRACASYNGRNYGDSVIQAEAEHREGQAGFI